MLTGEEVPPAATPPTTDGAAATATAVVDGKPSVTQGSASEPTALAPISEKESDKAVEEAVKAPASSISAITETEDVKPSVQPKQEESAVASSSAISVSASVPVSAVPAASAQANGEVASAPATPIAPAVVAAEPPSSSPTPAMTSPDPSDGKLRLKMFYLS